MKIKISKIAQKVATHPHDDILKLPRHAVINKTIEQKRTFLLN